MTPDANGNLIDTNFSGQISQTLWVSTSSATMFSAVSGGPGGADGDLTINLAIKDKSGRVVTQTSVEVNKPVQVLYAVDGTSATAANNYNVHQFAQRYQGIEGTDKHYWDGPQNVRTGSDSPGIVTNVENQIQADYATALQQHRRLVVDMVGWSRGAVIVATVARDLNTVNLTTTGFVIQPFAPQHIDVHWVRLFDAVSQMGGVGDPSIAPHNAWATVFSTNIHSHFHLIHTHHGKSRDYWPLNEDYLFPTEMGFVSSPGTTPTPFNMVDDSTHSDVGTNYVALWMMIVVAQAAGVTVQ